MTIPSMEPTRKPHYSFKAELHILLIPKQNVLAFRSFHLVSNERQSKREPKLAPTNHDYLHVGSKSAAIPPFQA